MSANVEKYCGEGTGISLDGLIYCRDTFRSRDPDAFQLKLVKDEFIVRRSHGVEGLTDGMRVRALQLKLGTAGPPPPPQMLEECQLFEQQQAESWTKIDWQAGGCWLRTRDLSPVEVGVTTSDLCHAHIKPETVPSGWRDEPQLITHDDDGNDVSAKRWYKHRYISETGKERAEKNSPPGTRSYCSLLAADDSTATFVGRPTHFLSHAWSYNIDQVLEAVRGFVQSQPVEARPAIFFWFDCLSLDQHATQQQQQGFDSDWWSTTFQEAIQAIGHTVMVISPWSNPTPLTRHWCLWEVYCTDQAGVSFDLALGPEDLKEFSNSLLSGEHNDRLAEVYSTVDVAKAGAANNEDSRRIMEAVRAVKGKLGDLDGCGRFNNIVQTKMQACFDKTMVQLVDAQRDQDGLIKTESLELASCVAAMMERRAFLPSGSESISANGREYMPYTLWYDVMLGWSKEWNSKSEPLMSAWPDCLSRPSDMRSAGDLFMKFAQSLEQLAGFVDTLQLRGSIAWQQINVGLATIATTVAALKYLAQTTDDANQLESIDKSIDDAWSQAAGVWSDEPGTPGLPAGLSKVGLKSWAVYTASMLCIGTRPTTSIEDWAIDTVVLRERLDRLEALRSRYLHFQARILEPPSTEAAHPVEALRERLDAWAGMSEMEKLMNGFSSGEIGEMTDVQFEQQFPSLCMDEQTATSSRRRLRRGLQRKEQADAEGLFQLCLNFGFGVDIPAKFPVLLRDFENDAWPHNRKQGKLVSSEKWRPDAEADLETLETKLIRVQLLDERRIIKVPARTLHGETHNQGSPLPHDLKLKVVLPE